MKTRDAPPEKGRDKGEANATAKPEMARFKKAAKEVMSVDREAVLDAEERLRRKRD